MQFLAALGLFVQISSAYHQHSWFEIPNAFETTRDRFTFQKVHSKLLLVDKNTNKCQVGCEVFSEKYLSTLSGLPILGGGSASRDVFSESYGTDDLNSKVALTAKGQLIFRKQIVKPGILPKNEQMNSFLLLCEMFLFVFWKKLKTPKMHFEIN